MTDKAKPAAELEVEARAINAEPWDPLPGMLKKRCSECRYFFAVPVTEAEATSRCPDCAGSGTRPVRKQP
jgi:predicted Zn-ribbon and HTH transcriptional regulator